MKLPHGTVTKIIGIGNQRVKECNRIEKVVEILNSFHILTYELKDGIAITSGCIFEKDQSSKINLKMEQKLIEVPTYEDHRLAMAFTIMGSAVATKNKVVIQNGRTVEKTFPEFWAHIYKYYNIDYSGYVYSQKEHSTRFGTDLDLLILIGMRNSGKSMYSNHLKENYGFQEYCLDAVFEENQGVTIQEFINEHGWEEFRQKETETFLKIIAKSNFSNNFRSSLHL